MTERLTPSGSFHPTPHALEPMNRLNFTTSLVPPDHSHHTPLPDVPQALLARPSTDHQREVSFPLSQDRAVRRFGAWRNGSRPAFALPSANFGPLAAALACPDLFLLDSPLGQERLNAILAIVEGARSSGQRLAILTSHPDNANAVVLALPAIGVGRAKAEHEPDLPTVVAEQAAKAIALGEWRNRRSALLAQKQDTAKQWNWWNEWDRLAEAEAAIAASSAPEPEYLRRAAEDHAAKLELLQASVIADAMIRNSLEAQLAQARPVAESPGGLGGFVKKLFGATKADPATVAIETKLKELDTAAAARQQLIAEAETHYDSSKSQILGDEQARIAACRGEQFADIQHRRDLLNSTRPSAGRDQLQKTLTELDATIADSEHAPATPLRDTMSRLTVVIGPLSALDCDPFFAPTHPEAEPAFDRVLFADAEDLNEIDFARATRLANAWTMLGSLDIPRPSYRNGKPGRGEFFRDTFDAVRTTPWRVENGRFVAILAKFDPRGIRSEPLADNPAIQLRFGDSELAEVAFPPSSTLIDIKRFLLAELGSPQAQFLGLPEWSADAEFLACTWSNLGRAFGLGSGIEESLHDGYTTQFRFAVAEGWTRDSAEAWYAEHFGNRPATRAAALDR